MQFHNIDYEVLDDVCRIWLNRPSARNAQSQALLEEMAAGFAAAESDHRIRVVIVAGRGEHFSAGHDLKEAGKKRSNLTVEERWAYESRHYYGLALDVWDFPKPTIAQVQGGCIAGAFMLANMCDLIVAADNAFFSDPVCRSLSAAAVEVLIHPWVLGGRRAKEFLYTGERMAAEEAWRIGMVNRVVPGAELEEATLKLAREIAAAPPFALHLTKRSINRTLDIQGLRSSLNAHFDTHQLSHNSAEMAAVTAQGLDRAITRGEGAGE
jgi:enoyl-CoA hydratase